MSFEIFRVRLMANYNTLFNTLFKLELSNSSLLRTLNKGLNSTSYWPGTEIQNETLLTLAVNYHCSTSRVVTECNDSN